MKKFSFLLLTFAVFLIAPLKADAAAAGPSNGDKTGIFNDIKVDSPVMGSVVAIFGDVYVNDSVEGEVVALFGNVKVNSKVSGRVVAVFGNVILTDRAVVYGDTVALGRLERSPGSRLYGQEVNLSFGFLPFGNAALIILSVIFETFVLIIGLLLLLIFNRRFISIAASLDLNMGRRMATGFLLLAASVLLLPFLAITVVGLLLYGLIIIAAEITGCIYFGRVMLGTQRAGGNILLQFFAGFLAITAVKIIFAAVSYQVGLLWSFLLLLALSTSIRAFGFGVLFDTKFGQLKKSPAA